MDEARKQWMQWAVRLQSIAQAGLFYGKDDFDLERYRQIRDIAAEMLERQLDLPLERVKELFCSETGYQTPKLDTRAAIFQGDGILLVRERDGLWSLPGGWVDMDLPAGENAVKEVKEEAGLDAEASLVVAVQDWDKRNRPAGSLQVRHICKIFVLCTATGGSFRPNLETLESGYFPLDRLPPLSEEKNTREQIQMCFDAHLAEHWTTLLD